MLGVQRPRVRLSLVGEKAMGANSWLELAEADDLDRLLEWTDREIEDMLEAVLENAEEDVDPTIEEGY